MRKVYQKLRPMRILFNKSIKIYIKALKESDSTADLKYSPIEAQQLENNEERKRKRKITWLDSPYLKNVKTIMGKVFLKLLKKHFSVSLFRHNIFNKNTVKLVTDA